MDHAQKRARSTNGLCGLGVRKLSARSSLHQAPLSFFHAVSRVPPRILLTKAKFAIPWEGLGCLANSETGLSGYSTPTHVPIMLSTLYDHESALRLWVCVWSEAVFLA
jgi:hypothetical protein